RNSWKTRRGSTSTSPAPPGWKTARRGSPRDRRASPCARWWNSCAAWRRVMAQAVRVRKPALPPRSKRRSDRKRESEFEIYRLTEVAIDGNLGFVSGPAEVGGNTGSKPASAQRRLVSGPVSRQEILSRDRFWQNRVTF